jgi:hypothetical protein
MTNYIHAYTKAMKVIDSCKNTYHLEACRTYINLYFKIYCNSTYITRSGLTTYVTTDIIGELYERLYSSLTLKEATLNE